MFTFTKKTDYALLALSFLATEGTGRIVGPREIARRYEIPAELLAKVMQTLARHRVVVSIPGPTGGYRLERSTSDISVAEIVEAVDGPLAIAQCWEDTGTDGCAQARHCHLRGPLARIQEEMARMLREMPLAEVCSPTLEYPDFSARVTGLPLVMASAPTVPKSGTE
jgi:Rrf2 family protein